MPPRTPLGILLMSFPAMPPTPGIMLTAPPAMLFTMEKKPGSPE